MLNDISYQLYFKESIVSFALVQRERVACEQRIFVVIFIKCFLKYLAHFEEKKN